MPSETFFRLPESKQERIVQAIKDEIARAPFEEFSIGNVIRNCGISRGSFYQYFHNKEDIFFYLISDYQNKIIQDIISTMQGNDGDLFDMLEIVFRHAVRLLCYKDSRQFRHNLFCNVHLFEAIWKQDGYPQERIQNYDRIRSYVNPAHLNLTDPQEINSLLEICINSALKDVAYIFITDESEEQVLNRFFVKLRLLRKAYGRLEAENGLLHGCPGKNC